jgi:hypothetical protein
MRFLAGRLFGGDRGDDPWLAVAHRMDSYAAHLLARSYGDQSGEWNSSAYSRLRVGAIIFGRPKRETNLFVLCAEPLKVPQISKLHD